MNGFFAAKRGITWRLLGVATAALLVASACSSSSASPTAGPITLNVLLMQQAAYSASDIQAMDAAFTKANPNITINPELVAYDSLHDKIVTA